MKNLIRKWEIKRNNLQIIQVMINISKTWIFMVKKEKFWTPGVKDQGSGPRLNLHLVQTSGETTSLL